MRWGGEESPHAVFIPPLARGCAVFGAGREDIGRFLRAAKNAGLAHRHVTTSRLRIPSLRSAPAAIAVFQDLPPCASAVDRLFNVILYPAWRRGIPLCFFSIASEPEYSPPPHLSHLLHTDRHAVMRALRAEQIIRLLRMQESPDVLRENFIRGTPSRTADIPVRDIALDSSQRRAASHGGGPMRVLAPAGSGKTRTIIGRICALIRAGVSPARILPLAFNRKAADEMNSRLDDLGIAGVRARTLHSFGYEIVRAGAGLSYDPEGETETTHALMSEALRESVPGADGALVASALSLQRRVKTELIPPADLLLGPQHAGISFEPFFDRFLRLQEERGALTFDDMIYRSLLLLLDNASLRRTFQERSKFILVDEYQDLNDAQILLLEILSMPENNIFVVGDDDQAIYGWRGASARNLLDFPAAFPAAEDCLLGTNYRSARTIIEHAGWLIARNDVRVPKRVSACAGAPAGSFQIMLCAGLWEQARAAASWVTGGYGDCGVRWEDSAILFRYNALMDIVAFALRRVDVPFDAGQCWRPGNSRVGRDIAAWFRLLLDPGSAGAEDLHRALSRPARVISREALAGIGGWSDVETLCARGAVSADDCALRAFVACLEDLRRRAAQQPAGELLVTLDVRLGLREFYRRAGNAVCDPDEADDATCYDVIAALAPQFQTPLEFLSHLAPESAGEPVCGTPRGKCVVLSTIHRAKGNEFSRVVCFDMSRRRRLCAGEMEEERRIAYVALTRACEAVLVTASGRRQSPFLREAALNPRFGGRLREEIESEILALRRRKQGTGDPSLIAALGEELRCRDMLAMSP